MHRETEERGERVNQHTRSLCKISQRGRVFCHPLLFCYSRPRKHPAASFPVIAQTRLSIHYVHVQLFSFAVWGARDVKSFFQFFFLSFFAVVFSKLGKNRMATNVITQTRSQFKELLGSARSSNDCWTRNQQFSWFCSIFNYKKSPSITPK